MRKLIWGAAMAGALTMAGCASTSDGESPATTATEPSNPANVVENASSDLVNSEFLNNQGEELACFTEGWYSFCAIIKNVATNWNAEGKLEGFKLEWDKKLKSTPPYTVTSGEAWGGVGTSVGTEYTDPPAMGVGRLRIESTGAGAVGMFELKPKKQPIKQLDGAQLDGAQLDGEQLDGEQLDGEQLDGAQLDGAQLDGALLDAAISDSTISPWGAVPVWKSNSTACEFTGYLGCFISQVFGGSYVWQPNSYTDDTASTPCRSGLCQTVQGQQGAPKSRHPQVNFTAITAPVSITVTNNSASTLLYERSQNARRFVLSKTAPNPEPMKTLLAPGQQTTFYGYRSLTNETSTVEMIFVDPKGGDRIITKTNLASKPGVEAKPSCEVQSGGNISKRYNCDASNTTSATITGDSSVEESPEVTVSYSVRS